MSRTELAEVWPPTARELQAQFEQRCNLCRKPEGTEQARAIDMLPALRRHSNIRHTAAMLLEFALAAFAEVA